jgi:hypothetical protein
MCPARRAHPARRVAALAIGAQASGGLLPNFYVATSVYACMDLYTMLHSLKNSPVCARSGTCLRGHYLEKQCIASALPMQSGL